MNPTRNSETPAQMPAQPMENRHLVLCLLWIISLISSTETFSINVNSRNKVIANNCAFVVPTSTRATSSLIAKITMIKHSTSKACHHLPKSKDFCRREVLTKYAGLGVAALAFTSPWIRTKDADGEFYVCSCCSYAST